MKKEPLYRPKHLSMVLVRIQKMIIQKEQEEKENQGLFKQIKKVFK